MKAWNNRTTRILILLTYMIKSVNGTEWTDGPFKKAVKAYLADPAAGEKEHGHIGTWDVSKVTKMDYLFTYADKFNEDISKWDVGNVVDMSGMFDNAKRFNQDISGWNVGNVKSMYAMFTYAASFNQDLSSWDVSNVEDMTGMFWEAISFNQKICWKMNPNTKMDWIFFKINAKLSCEK